MVSGFYFSQDLLTILSAYEDSRFFMGESDVVHCVRVSLTVEMFLGQKLAERERTGQRSYSKQGLSCPGFFPSIPVLNGLSDRSKPVQKII